MHQQAHVEGLHELRNVQFIRDFAFGYVLLARTEILCSSELFRL